MCRYCALIDEKGYRSRSVTACRRGISERIDVRAASSLAHAGASVNMKLAAPAGRAARRASTLCALTSVASTVRTFYECHLASQCARRYECSGLPERRLLRATGMQR